MLEKCKYYIMKDLQELHMFHSQKRLYLNKVLPLLSFTRLPRELLVYTGVIKDVTRFLYDVSLNDYFHRASILLLTESLTTQCTTLLPGKCSNLEDRKH